MYTRCGRRFGRELPAVRVRGEPGEGDVEAGSGRGPGADRRRKAELVHTPGQKTIEDVAEFLKFAEAQIKSWRLHGSGERLAKRAR